MKRRTLLQVAGATAALAAFRPALAQPAGRIARIGYLSVTPTRSDPYGPSFVEGMRDLGYVEGRNLHIEYRSAEGDLSRLPALAKELVALRPDVILASNPAGVGAALAATKTIPIVMGTMSDPVLEGFAASLARPGGNVTGVVNQGEDLIPKQFELVRNLLPRASRVAFLVNKDPVLRRRTESFESVAQDSARRLGLK
ncbi:MAG: ABC transporter substrate-binding protein, partial [Burkholderiales bacterium]